MLWCVLKPWMCWYWGLLGGTLVNLNVTCHLWPALGYLLGAIWLATACTKLSCIWEEPSYILRLTSINIKPGTGQQKGTGHPEICFCLLAVRWAQSLKEPLGIWVLWDRFSVSHKVGESSGHQLDRDSNLVALLYLKPLTESLREHQGQLPAIACKVLLWCWVSGSHQGRAKGVDQAKTD